MVQKYILKDKKGIAPIGFILLAVAGIFILSYMGKIDLSSMINTAQVTGSGSYIERPVFYYDKCEATSSYKYSEPTSIDMNGGWLNKPSVSSSYDIVITYPKEYKLATCLQLEYYICNSKLFNPSNCRVYSTKIRADASGGSYKILNVKNNEIVWAQYQQSFTCLTYSGSSDATYQIGWIPYEIRQYNVLGGSGAQINPNSCTYLTAPTDSLVSSDSKKINDVYSGIDKSTNQNVLQPEEVRWYVAGYLTSASPIFALIYNEKNAWCRPTGSTGEIYAINKVTTAQGTYNIASADWSDYLGNVNCCPKQAQGDQVCNDNFKWVQIGGSECGLFTSCGSPNWVPYTEKQLIKYSCVSGKCQSEIKQVDCASDKDCVDTNQVCDLNIYKCVDANINLKGQTITTLPDNQMDCEKQGGNWITQKTEDASLLNWIGIGTPQIITTEYCDLNKTNWTLYIIIGIIILVLIVFKNQIMAIVRRIIPF
jgi:hypothetical protein